MLVLLIFWVVVVLSVNYYIFTTWSFCTLLILTILNILGGILIVEWSWNGLARIRSLDEERDA